LNDFNEWIAFFKDPETSRHWESEKEDPGTECRKWYERQLQRYADEEGGMNALVEKISGKLVGHCGLLKQEVDGIDEVEIAWSLLPAFWNKGYATEAAMKCKDYAFQNNFCDSLISIISLTNIPSEKVALKNGMFVDRKTIYNGNEVNIFRVNK